MTPRHAKSGSLEAVVRPISLIVHGSCTRRRVLYSLLTDVPLCMLHRTDSDRDESHVRRPLRP